MDLQIDRFMDRLINIQVDDDIQIVKWIDRQIYGQIDEQISRYIDRLVNRWMAGQKERQIIVYQS